MTSTVYIESINKFPSEDWSCSAYLGFRANGANIKLFEDIEEVPLNRYTTLVASIENTHQWMEGMGWNIPESITMPPELCSTWWTNRKITKMSLGEALAITDYPYFVKSYELKKFIPGVVKHHKDKSWFNNELDRKMPVLVSEVINFVSEYRVYVLEGKVIGCNWYTGDMRYYPEFDVIENMVKQFSRAPKFYSLDVGIELSKDKRLQFTRLVECNDGYSLGNYGLSPRLYTRGLTTRWRQLLEQNPVK